MYYSFCLVNLNLLRKLIVFLQTSPTISKKFRRLLKFSLRIHRKNGYQFYATILYTVAPALPPLYALLGKMSSADKGLQ